MDASGDQPHELQLTVRLDVLPADPGIGSGLGPLIVGALSVRLDAAYGQEAIRFGLAWVSIGFVLAAATCLAAAPSVGGDLERTRRESEAESAQSGDAVEAAVGGRA